MYTRGRMWVKLARIEPRPRPEHDSRPNGHRLSLPPPPFHPFPLSPSYSPSTPFHSRPGYFTSGFSSRSLYRSVEFVGQVVSPISAPLDSTKEPLLLVKQRAIFELRCSSVIASCYRSAPFKHSPRKRGNLRPQPRRNENEPC